MLSTLVGSRPPAAAALPASAPVGRFQWHDYTAALLVFVITLAVYVYTLCPNTALEDSGELITGAIVFGVPHPPGYPLWSLCGFIFSHLFPVGNDAWRTNLTSALFGAAANAILALLISHSGRRMIHEFNPGKPEQEKFLPFYGAVASGLILGFSSVMWSQAVIAEVFTLNALFIMAVFLCFYRWMAETERTGWLQAAIFVFCLGLTHHHTLIFVSPAFLLGVFLADRRLFPSFLIGICILCMTTFAGFSWLSEDVQLQEIARRTAFGVVIITAFLSFWHARIFSFWLFIQGGLLVGCIWALALYTMGGWFSLHSSSAALLFIFALLAIGLLATAELNHRLIAGIVLLGWIGLLPYAYMPIAARTNPPMNWGYAGSKTGFYYAINRGQYPNNLAAMIEKVLGPVTGVHSTDGKPPSKIEEQVDYIAAIIRAIKQYWRSLELNFTFPICVFAFLPMLYFRRLAIQEQRWLYFLIFSYFLLAVMQTLMDPPASQDTQTIWVVRRFMLQSHCLFVLAVGYGIIGGASFLLEYYPGFTPSNCFPLLLLPLLPFYQNLNLVRQDGHWFGWQFGVDILRPLEKGAVYFGGTDQGRFVPTYMIFCESQQPARFKRDPSFDRRDIYVITQNALADKTYLNYIRDHYDADHRPKTFNAFEKWLGRDHQYPVESLKLPSDTEFEKIYTDFYTAMQQRIAAGASRPELGSIEDVFDINGRVAKEIFEANKKTHTFYFEESLPIFWMYAYAVPSGLLMKLNPEPLAQLDPEIIKKDREFWDAYSARLLADPLFLADPAAQRAFAKLRASIGNMYRFRNLFGEAEYAYRQAHKLGPDDEEADQYYADMLIAQGRYDDAENLLKEALDLDPRSGPLKSMVQIISDNRQKVVKLTQLRGLIAQDPMNYRLRMELINNLLAVRQFNAIDREVEQVMEIPDTPNESIVSCMRLLESMHHPNECLRILEIRAKVDPKNADVLYNLAAFYLKKGEKEKVLPLLSRAFIYGGTNFIEVAKDDPRFNELRKNPAFIKLLVPAYRDVKTIRK
jgi:tetratricopeptide (TPR) repeat protein